MGKPNSFTILSLALYALFPPSSEAGRRALLVGINTYMYYEKGSLRGPLNDLEWFKEILLSKADFHQEDIVLVRDTDATSRRIHESLRKLAEGASKGDLLLFYFAGHGSQVHDLNDDESDGIDEILLPTDTENGNLDSVLFDDEMRKIIDSRHDVQWIIILDCCHAGTGTKNLTFDPGNDVARFAPLQFFQKPSGDGFTAVASGEDQDSDEFARSVAPFQFDGERNDKGFLDGPTTRAREIVSSDEAPAVFAACHPEEVSLETLFKGKHHGKFTYRLLDLIARGEIKIGESTYQEVARKLTVQLQGNLGGQLVRQDPLIEIPNSIRDTPFLSEPNRNTKPDPQPTKIQEAPPKNNKPSNRYKVSIETIHDHRFYTEGDTVDLRVTSSQDGFLLLLNWQSTGCVHVLFPNEHERKGFIRARTPIEIPGEAAFTLTVRGPNFGKEKIQAIVTESPVEFIALRNANIIPGHDFKTLCKSGARGLSTELNEKGIYVESARSAQSDQIGDYGTAEIEIETREVVSFP